MKAGVFGIGSALPDHIITNAHLESYLDTDDAWIVRRTGIRERRHLNGAVTLTDLAERASLDALKDADRDPADVDQVIVSTFTPDRVLPGMAAELATRIGATRSGAVDVNALRDGRVETFHGVDCTEDTFRQFREWLDPRKPVVFVSDNPAYDFQWINFYFWRYFGENPFGHSGRRIADFYAGLMGDFRSTQKWKRLRRTKHDHHPVHDALGNAEALIRIFDGER